MQLQQLGSSGAWTTLKQLPLNKNGNVTFPSPGNSDGATLRIAMSVNQAGAGLLGTTSHTLLYHTKFVSLNAKATQVLFGNSLTLSGQTSVRTAGQTITILAWRYGNSSPTKIATFKTVTGGHWSFKVSPTIQTSYAARWGASDSDKVVIGVKPLATLTMLADGRISTHIAAGRSFGGQKVQLQELVSGSSIWQTITELPLNAKSSAVFSALSAGGKTLRIAMSVNQAGAGFLGTSSHEFIYRA